MFNKGRSGLMNFNMSMSDSSPGADHREKSGILGEGHLNQIRTSNEDAERPTVRSMKFFFEAKMKGESTKNSVSKIASDEEAQPLDLKRSKVRLFSNFSFTISWPLKVIAADDSEGENYTTQDPISCSSSSTSRESSI